MTTIKKTCLSLQTLSIDIMIGILGSASLAAHVTGKAPPLAWWALLLIASWAVYTLDHLIDARPLRQHPDRNYLHPRHRFHARHFHLLWVLVMAASALAAYIVFRYGSMPWLIAGLLLGGLSLAYSLFSRHRMFAPLKEGWVALIYTAGIWFYPLYLTALSLPLLLVVMIFLLAVYENLLMYAVLEKEIDSHDGLSSAAVLWGENHVVFMITIMTILAAIMSVSLIIMYPPPYRDGGIFLLITSLMTFTLVKVKNTFRPTYIYRLLGELPFWLPLLLWGL